MPKTWKDARLHDRKLEVLRSVDGTHEVIFDGEIVGSMIPEQYLSEIVCARYGFCGKEFEELVNDLKNFGRVVRVF
jgi:hypothetical protein